MGDHRRVWQLALLLVMALSFSPMVSADIRDAKIIAPNNTRIFLDYFGFKPNEGRLELNVSNISFSSPPLISHQLNLSQIGFFLTQRNFSTDVFDLGDIHSCALHSSFSNIVYTFDNLINKTSFDLLLTDTVGHVYNLWFENCLSDHDFNVSMNVRSAMYNLEPGSELRSYLSATKLALPNIYSFFLCAYLCLASLWVYALWKNRELACRIHIGILVVLMLKSMSFLLELIHLSYILQTGCSQCWYPIVLLFTSGLLDGIPFTVLMVLILCGWSYMKPHLSPMQKFWIWSVILIGIGFNCFNTIYDGRGYASNSCYVCGLMASLDVFANCFVFLFMALCDSTKFLNQARKAHGKASIAYEKITQMRASFCAYLLLIVVMFFVVLVLDSICPTPRYLWLSVALKEASIFIFYVFIAYKSRPTMHNIMINDDVEKAAAEAFSFWTISQ